MGPLWTCRRQQRVASDIWWHRDTRARCWGHKPPLTGTAPAHTGIHRLQWGCRDHHHGAVQTAVLGTHRQWSQGGTDHPCRDGEIVVMEMHRDTEVSILMIPGDTWTTSTGMNEPLSWGWIATEPQASPLWTQSQGPVGTSDCGRQGQGPRGWGRDKHWGHFHGSELQSNVRAESGPS